MSGTLPRSHTRGSTCRHRARGHAGLYVPLRPVLPRGQTQLSPIQQCRSSIAIAQPLEPCQSSYADFYGMGSMEEELGWRTDLTKQYVKGRLLGQGSFGVVYLGVDLHTVSSQGPQDVAHGSGGSLSRSPGWVSTSVALQPAC